jgi:hypothetical protein
VRSLLGSGDSLDLELEPIAFLEVMNTSVEGQQELKSMIGRLVDHFIWSDGMYGRLIRVKEKIV